MGIPVRKTTLPLPARERDSESQIEERARLSPRAGVELEVGVSTEHNFWSGLTLNVSEGGVFIATHHDVPLGTVLSLSISLPDGEEPIVALGEVRWRRPWGGDPDVPPGLGVKFVDVGDAALTRMRCFVQAVRDPLYFED